MTLESGVDDLKGLQSLLNVYDELGGESESSLEDLVTPYRRALCSQQVLLKQPPVSGNGDPAKVWVLSDVLLIGLNTRKLGRVKRSGTLDKGHKKGTLEIKKGTLSKFRGDYKLLHYLDIRNCKVRSLGLDEDGLAGSQVTHVSRERSTTNPSSKNGTIKVVTKIAKLELWFSTPEECQEFEQGFADAVEDLLMQDESDAPTQTMVSRVGSLASTVTNRLSLTRSNSTVSSPGGGEKQRKWAVNRVRRSTLEKQASTFSRRGSNRSGADEDEEDEAESVSRSGSIVSSSESVSAESVGGLSLSDLEKRYHTDLSTCLPTGEDGASMEIEVEFGEGKMGLSLGSGAGIGVIVGALAPNGFAEMAGVLVSDRVCAINDEEVGLDDHWQEVLDKLKKYPRPIRVKFQRFTARTHELVKKNKELAHIKGPATKGQDSSGTSRAKARELGKILSKAERVIGRGESLQVILRKVVEDQTSGSDRRSLASVLEEISKTEIIYVKDLRNMICTYILPLRNERRKTKCRHIEDGSTFCEHGFLRGTCLRSASEHQPLLNSIQLQSIFLNVETIIYINTELLRLLQLNLSTISAGGKVPSLEVVIKAYADSFKTVMPFFKAYSVFCRGYEEAVESLDALRKTNPSFGSFLTKLERTAIEEKDPSKRVLSLPSLLIKPVQRICKYPLLFNELLRHAQAGVPGLEELELAANEVERIAESVNQTVGEEKQNEPFRLLMEALNQEDRERLVAPSRRYLFEADVMVTESPFGETPAQPRTLFVFNDLVVIAKGDTGTITRARSLKRLSVSRSKSGTGSTLTGPVHQKSIWGKLLGVFTGNDEEDSHAGESRQSLARKASLAKKGRNLKIVHMFPMKALTIKQDDGESLAFVITVKERTLVENERAKKGGTEKWVTNINKYLVACDTEGLVDELFNHIEQAQAKLKELEKGHQKGESLYGTKKEKRGWAKKSNGTLKAKVV